jgi:hypothetical protein
MSCKKGGLVMLRHNDVVAEWHHLCAQALTPSAVSKESLINRGRDGQAGANAAGAEELPKLCGNVAAHGFWRRGRTAIFETHPPTAAKTLTRFWQSRRRRRRQSTLGPVWLDDEPSLLLCSWLMAWEVPRRRQHQSSSPHASLQSGSERTLMLADMSAPTSQSR